MVYVKMVNNSFKILARKVRFTDCLLLLPTCLFLGQTDFSPVKIQLEHIKGQV